MGELNPVTHARRYDPDTSHDAAAQVTTAVTMKRRLLTAFKYHNFLGLTADEAASACGYDASDGAWKRVSDLKLAGLITDTGARRPGFSGRKQAVYRITDAGMEMFR